MPWATRWIACVREKRWIDPNQQAQTVRVIEEMYHEATRPIGSDELTRIMEEAEASALRELNRAQDELEAADAALR